MGNNAVVDLRYHIVATSQNGWEGSMEEIMRDRARWIKLV